MSELFDNKSGEGRRYDPRWIGGSPGTSSGQQRSPIRMRAGDADRSAAVEALSEHFVVGRLDQEEFEARSAAALRAVYLDELDPLFGDLPVNRSVEPPWRSGDRRPSTELPEPSPRKRDRSAARHWAFEPAMWRVVWVLAVLLVLATRGAMLWVLLALWWFTAAARGGGVGCGSRARSRRAERIEGQSGSYYR